MARRGSRLLARGLLVGGLLASPSAAAQPIGDQLAFVAGRIGAQQLCVLDASRLTTRCLPGGHGQIDGPAWAPDGRRLVFTAVSGGTSAIFVVNRDGSGLRRLAAGRHPAGSPDGSRIAFATTERDNEDVVLLTLDTAARRRLTTHPSRDFSPQWSPDGARLVFASGRGESSRLGGREYGSEIYLASADGAAVEALTAHNACGLTHDGEGKLNHPGPAAWTPDGRRVLYRAGSCKFACRVCVIDLTSRRVHPLSSEDRTTAFTLSPDGRSVAYVSQRGIVLADLTGGADRVLVTDGWAPAWSRDGRRIAFLVSAGAEGGADRHHIETVTPEGENRRRLSTQAGAYGWLTWAPAPHR